MADTPARPIPALSDRRPLYARIRLDFSDYGFTLCNSLSRRHSKLYQSRLAI